MNVADLAVIAVTVVGLANVAKDYRVQMRIVDRLRLVNPVKPPEAPRRDAEASKVPTAGDVKTGPVPLEKVS